ncbi:MAG: hypothetical protein ABI378_10535, partial [Chitinophagaceae bacterium]
MISSTQLKQILLLLFILFAGVLVFYELYPFLPGLLGAVTLYILLRQWFFKLTVIYNWKKWLAATVFILGSIVVFVIPITLTVLLIAPKVMLLVQNPSLITNGVSSVVAAIHQR